MSATLRGRPGCLVALLTTGFLMLGLTGAASATSDTTQFSVVAGSLSFGVSPDVPNLPTLNLNGQAQTLTAQMNSFSVVDATGSGSGWNVTVSGDGSGGHSAVFKQYCPGPGNCGSDSPGYVSSGATLAANSLSLSSTGAGFTALNGTTGTAPSHQCGSGCFVDAGSATKILSAASGAGMGTWQTSGWGASSLSLSAPTTILALPSSEVYHVDLVWTLNTGP
jgi:WxL domain surface cell wall-binding